MTKSEKTAIRLVDQLLNYATSAEIQSDSDFSKGLASGYRTAAQTILLELRLDKFSE